jgi:alkanesulfonate monooxygenase SsuD/methylene tetrahydromethanopterin reductase-like flavin-dependent oxidoreductase (luciferase family)
MSVPWALRTDLLFDPFDADWNTLRAAATTAENAGFDGLWTWDHLMGGVHRAGHVLECWTLLTALAAITQRAAIGPLVLNVANRHAGVTAVMAATLQHISGGRVLLGLGAGGGAQTPYAAEQAAFGKSVPRDAVRRWHVEEAVDVLRQVGVGECSPQPPTIFRSARARASCGHSLCHPLSSARLGQRWPRWQVALATGSIPRQGTRA